MVRTPRPGDRQVHYGCRWQVALATTRADALKRRKELYEAKHPESRANVRGGKSGGKGRPKSASDNVSLAKPFAVDAARKLGVDERTIRLTAGETSSITSDPSACASEERSTRSKARSHTGMGDGQRETSCESTWGTAEGPSSSPYSECTNCGFAALRRVDGRATRWRCLPGSCHSDRGLRIPCPRSHDADREACARKLRRHRSDHGVQTHRRA